MKWRELLAETTATIGERPAARWLCEVASGADRIEDVLDEPATQRMVAHLDAMIERHRAGEPLAYVLGRWSFRHLDLAVDRRVLIPRPETEVVAGVAIDLARGLPRPLTLADLGTGSGAIGLALADELPLDGVSIWLTDASPDAIDVARANLAGIGRRGANVRIAEGSWFDALPAGVVADLVVANPPYVATGSSLVDEAVVAWEPHDALFAGSDGLDAIRVLVAGAPSRVRARRMARAGDRCRSRPRRGAPPRGPRVHRRGDPARSRRARPGRRRACVLTTAIAMTMLGEGELPGSGGVAESDRSLARGLARLTRSEMSTAWIGDDGRAARRGARIGTAIAVGVFLLLATNGRPWHVFDRGPFSSDFYDAQARALSRGHLAVDPAVASIEGFVHDGQVHFYYGIVPALARLPISAFTHALDGRLVLASLLGGLTVGCLAAARLLQRARGALAIDVPSRRWAWTTGVFAAAVGLSTPLLWLSSRALVYHEAELWGAALAILGFERVVVWWSTRRDVDLAWASGAAALALGTRGSSGSGPALALGGLVVVLLWRRAWRDAATTALAAAVPVLLYAAVNAARFGTPFSVPFDAQVLNAFSAPRRAALEDNRGTLFGLKFMPTAALQYLRPDTVAPRRSVPVALVGRPGGCRR